MRKFLIGIISAVTLTATAAHAQEIGGLVMDRDIVTPADMYAMSHNPFTFGTARSMSMAGAFTSLGADLSSMAQNPAGLGFYQRQDLSLTPLMTFNRAKNSAGLAVDGGNRMNRFGFGNIGYAFPVYRGTGAVTGVTVGVGFNRITDLNYKYSFGSDGNMWSVADAMSGLLQDSGLTPGDLMNSTDIFWNDIDPRFWGAAMGYRNGLTDYVDTDSDGEADTWIPTWIGNSVDAGHYMDVISRGSIGEYDLSFGMNFNNKFYLGATFGIQAISQRLSYYYTEDYFYENADSNNPNGIDPSLDYQLRETMFDQEVRLTGAGVNFKVGAIYRPVSNLRIGLAFHTPTARFLDRTYYTAMNTFVQANNDTDPEGFGVGRGDTFERSWSSITLEDLGENGWDFADPMRLMAGISYTFGNRGVISVDYQRDWYNDIRMNENPAGMSNSFWNDTFRDWFKGSNTIRVGAEFKPAPWLALRAGAGYMGGALRDYGQIMSEPVTREMYYYSGGIGFTLSPNVYLDLAYSYTDRKTTDFDLFYYDTPDGIAGSSLYNTRLVRHTGAVTLGFRF